MRLYKYKTEEEQLAAVRQNGYAIQFIHNPSEAIQLEAIKQNGYALEYNHNPSEKLQLEAVKQKGYAIQFIHNPSEGVIKYLLDNYSSNEDVIQLLFAVIGEEGYNKLSDEDKLKLELSD